MKKNILLITMMATILLAGCSDQTAQKSNSEQSPQSSQSVNASNDDLIDMSKFTIKKIGNKDSLPIAVSSIQEVLLSTGRVHKSEVTGNKGSLYVRDVSLQLGDEQKDGSATASFTYQEMKSPKDSTSIVSYNFAKSTMQTDKAEDIKWGLKTFLQLFDSELTDNMWNNIATVSAMKGDAAGMGTDYWGYGDEQKGIQLIYTNLNENVQIDIHPYSEYMGKQPSGIKSLQQR